MTRKVPALLAILVLLAFLPGVAAAETRSGGTVIVGADETVDDDLDAFAGTVVVRGTVTGDLNAFGGSVRIAPGGTVEGSVEVASGSVEIAGTVGGDVEAAGGSVDVRDTAEIGGVLEAGAGSIVVDGTVRDDARLGADTIRLGPNASIAGDLTYDGDLVRAEGATVDGTVTRSEGLDVGVDEPIVNVPEGAFIVYGILTTLLIGAVLVLAFPRFSDGIAASVTDDPVRTGGIGLLALIVIPIVLVLLLVTIVGIPLSIIGFILFGLLAWIGSIYGRYAVGEWLLSYTDSDNRLLALVVGVVAVALLALVPVLGWLVELVVWLLGFGALVLGMQALYGDRERSEPAAGTEAGTV